MHFTVTGRYPVGHYERDGECVPGAGLIGMALVAEAGSCRITRLTPFRDILICDKWRHSPVYSGISLQ